MTNRRFRSMRLYLLLIVVAVLASATWSLYGPRPMTATPACVGLDCRNDADCGTRCKCTRSADGGLGTCRIR